MAEHEYRPGFVTWSGLFTVWLTAAVLSFASLRDLAASCRVSTELAPLLPVVIDVGAAVATRAWLSRRANPDAERFARWLTWTLLALTVALNAAHQGMVANGVTPPWQVAVVVGAIPPVVVGSTVHLAVLLGRAPVRVTSEEKRGVTVPAAPIRQQPTVAPTTPRVKPVSLPLTPAKTSAETTARAIVKANPGIGRNVLAREAGVSAHVARKVLAEMAPRNGAKVTTGA